MKLQWERINCDLCGADVEQNTCRCDKCTWEAARVKPGGTGPKVLATAETGAVTWLLLRSVNPISITWVYSKYGFLFIVTLNPNIIT